MTHPFRLILVALVALVPILGRVAIAQSDFYAGKTITLIVGYSAGGGYDQYSRLLARHFGRHIPGNPNVVVQNMPGAASLTAVRYLANAAPKDGTAMTMFDPGLVLESLALPDKFKVKFTDYQWLGAMSREVTLCYAWHATGIRSFDEMMKRNEFLLGATAKGSAVYFNGATLRKIFHAPIRQIGGYPGSNEQRLAIERGELEGACASWSAIPQDWIVNHKINVLVRFGPQYPADMPPNVPYIDDLAASPEQKDLLDILNAPGILGRPFIIAKEAPRERVQTLISAFAATLKDPALLAEAKKQSLPIELFNAAESEKIIETIYSAPPQVVQQIRDIIE
jgi:tripartite-type tricarboxylate transporter receptor subunit TctC